MGAGSRRKGFPARLMSKRLSSRFQFGISTGWWAAIFWGLTTLSGAITGWAEEKIFLPAIIRAGSGPVLSGCPVFPADHIWNAAIDHLPTDPLSDPFVTTIGLTKGVHADFGSGTWDGGPIGIPFIVVPGSQSKVPVTFDYREESDPGPYPIPPNPPIEGGAAGQGDRHVLILDSDHCRLYELYNAWPQPDGSWQAGSGAQFDLNSYTG